MQYENLPKEEKRKLMCLIRDEYIDVDFSNAFLLPNTNFDEPRWMDTYVYLYKANLPSDIIIYNILLEKLSTSFMYMQIDNGKDVYISNCNELMLREYVRYLITKEPNRYYAKAKYIPAKEYTKELIKLDKFNKCGIYVKHICNEKFEIHPLGIEVDGIKKARSVYDELLDYNDFYKNVNMDKSIMLQNYEAILNLSKDKRMLATISNITNYFNCKFSMVNSNITFDGTDIIINDEDTATNFQARIIDAYHFYRNVINTTNKKDIISEIYNKRVDSEILNEFVENASSYINIVTNKDLIDWIVTISKESNYTLNITYDDQGVFYIDGSIIVTPLDAKEYYIDYMDRKKEKLAMAIYKNNIVTKIKKIWNKFKAKFARA